MIQFIEDRNTAACCVVYASFAEVLVGVMPSVASARLVL